MKLAEKPNPQFDLVDPTLYTTILDSSAVRKEGILCQRCKSEFHLVRDSSFWEKTTLEENKGTKKTGQGASADQWKVAISSSDEPANKARNANVPSYARLVGGPCPCRLQDLSILKLDSPFNLETWKHFLSDCYDSTIVDELPTGIRRRSESPKS